MNALRFNLGFGDLSTLNPHVGSDLRCRSFIKALFEGLTRLNPDGHIEFAGAERVELSNDGKHYTFHLRPHLWSNGASVTAKDYELTWKKALTPGTDCRFGEYFFIIKNGAKAKKGAIAIDEVGIKAIDDYTLHVELEHPAPYFLGLTATALYSPLFMGNEDEPITFNGPFLLAAWEHDKRILLESNPTYWDHKNVFLKAIEAFMIKDERVAFEMFEKGDIDWVGDPFSPLPMDVIPQLAAKNLLQKKEIARICLLFCNTRQFPLQSKKIRQALDYALNRQELSELVLMGQRAHDAPVPIQYSLLETEEDLLKGNSEKAKQLFAEGLLELNIDKSSFPPLTFSYAHEALFKNIALYLQRTWEDILGIKVNLQGYDWNLLFADLNRHQFQLGSCFHASFFNDPIYNLAMYEDAHQSVNWTGWENDHFKTLIDQSKTISDSHERNKVLREAESILKDEKPSMPLYVQTYFYVTNEKMESPIITDLGYVEFKHMNLKSDKKI